MYSLIFKACGYRRGKDQISLAFIYSQQCALFSLINCLTAEKKKKHDKTDKK